MADEGLTDTLPWITGRRAAARPIRGEMHTVFESRQMRAAASAQKTVGRMNARASSAAGRVHYTQGCPRQPEQCLLRAAIATISMRAHADDERSSFSVDRR